MIISSQITFFYYDNMEEASQFYEEIMRFPIVQDQGFAKIYRAGKSFFGIVDGKTGSLRAQSENAAMLTLLVDNVSEWHEYLVSNGVKVWKEPQKGSFAETGFYFDPGGYVVEIQHFNNPDEHKVFE